jgi:hypothetical protein
MRITFNPGMCFRGISCTLRIQVAKMSQLLRQKKLARRFPAALTDPTDLQADDADLKSALLGHLLLQPFKGGACVLHDGPAAKAGHMGVIAIRLGLVVMSLALDVHQIQFIDQAPLLQEGNSPIDGRAVDVGVLLLSEAEKVGGIQMPGRVLDDANQQASLGCHPDSFGGKLIQ